VRSAGAGQDGAAELWVAVFTADWQLMGAAAAPARLALVWRDGALCLQYAPVTVTVARAGRYSAAVLCAVMRGARQYKPLVAVALKPPHQMMRPGTTITVADGVIALASFDTPDPPGLTGPYGPAVSPGQ
jgi:hypothetical protein